MAVKQFSASLLCICVALWFLLIWLNQSANMKMQPSPGHSTWSRSSEGLLFATKSSERPFLVCGVFYNTVLNLPHLLSMVPQNATPASVSVSPVSWKHTFSVSHPQPHFASDPLSSFLQEPSPVLISMKIAFSREAIIGLFWIALNETKSVALVGLSCDSTRILKYQCRQVSRSVCMNWKGGAQDNRFGAAGKDTYKLERRKAGWPNPGLQKEGATLATS